ncbi:SRPBCC family protein [Planctomicrobium sp. SH664]|uniref:SRPBCC family protein n=1 Tax=Planctomicrobium sp. SH664 TaxID=3448125 RepID=UPI003F5AE5F6
MPLLEYEVEFPCSATALFDFLARPANIVRVTRPDLGIKFTSAPDVLAAGSQLDFQIVTMGQVVKSTHRIAQFEHAKLVVEQQVTGPMKAWMHSHIYEPTGTGVILRERVEYQLPGGLLGFLLTESKINDHLEDGFFYRDQKLNDLIKQGVIA